MCVCACQCVFVEGGEEGVAADTFQAHFVADAPVSGGDVVPTHGLRARARVCAMHALMRVLHAWSLCCSTHFFAYLCCMCWQVCRPCVHVCHVFVNVWCVCVRVCVRACYT